MAQKEAFQWNSQREAAVAEVHRVTTELAVYQQRHEQLKANAASEMRHEAGVAQQIEAKWRQECQVQKNHWEQECQQLKIESQRAQGYLLDRGHQDQADQMHLQERALALQKETASLVQQQQAVGF